MEKENIQPNLDYSNKNIIGMTKKTTPFSSHKIYGFRSPLQQTVLPAEYNYRKFNETESHEKEKKKDEKFIFLGAANRNFNLVGILSTIEK